MLSFHSIFIICILISKSIADRFEDSDDHTTSIDDSTEDFKVNGGIGVNFYDFVVKDAHDKDVALRKFKGNVVLVTNVASECGFTDSHYRELTQLQADYKSAKNFHVLAFPCNQFGYQEPKSSEEIAKWAVETYDINFPLLAKIEVVGENVEPAFQNLIDQSGLEPDWNFWKYLVDHKGHVLGAWGPRTTAFDLRLEIEAALKDAKSNHDPNKL